MSSATGARVSVFSVGAAASVACSAPIEEKSRSGLRHCTIFTGSNVCVSRACPSSVSNGGPRAAAGGAEGAVAARAPGATRDLRELGRAELAELIAVELAVGRKRDVIDVEIETHADGIGRHQEIDIAGLIKRDLRV